MLTQLFRITPPGDGQSNSNLNSLGVVAYEQVFDPTNNVWNARRGAHDIVGLSLANRAGGTTFDTAILDNFNSSKIIMICLSANVNSLFNLYGIDLASGQLFPVADINNVSAHTVGTATVQAFFYDNLPRKFFGRLVTGGPGPISTSLGFSLSGY